MLPSALRVLYRQSSASVLILFLCCWNAYSYEKVEPEGGEPWIRGTTENLEMRIRGQILDFNGQPAHAPSVSVFIRDKYSNEAVAAQVDGNQFEVWLPVYRGDWHSFRIQAESKDAVLSASAIHARPSLRQIAMNEQTVTLQPSSRSVIAKVVHDNSPVAGANLNVETSDRAVMKLQCDASGSVNINLRPDEQIVSFTSWTDKPLFGGFQFSRQPVRDQDDDTQTIQLYSCREQKFRVVDGQGNPCSDVEMHLHVATPSPNFNYLGSIEASRMITNKDGESVFRWFPDWEDVHCYVDLKSDLWVIDGKSKWIDGVLVVQVKPRALRRKVFGKLDGDDESKAGYCVSWRSFQGEQENQSDFITSVTDRQGNFSADVLPDATYCVFINDTQDVSDMVNLIPAPKDDASAPSAVIRLQEPEVLGIFVTTGPTKRPVTNQSVYVRQTHDYQWMEEGEQRSGSSARDRYVRTNDQGKATAVVESGKEVEVSIFNPDWRTSEKLRIAAGEHNAVVLHRDIDSPRPILGIVVQNDNNPIPTDDITIIAGSVDGETRGTEELSLRDNGVFLFHTQAVAVGFLATTKEQSMAGVLVAENPPRLLRLTLQPTKRLSGRLIDSDGQPIVGRTVHAAVRVTHKPKNRELNSFYGFEAFSRAVKTDADGNYAFDAMPTEVEIAVSVESLYKQRNHWLGIVELKSNEDYAGDTDTIED